MCKTRENKIFRCHCGSTYFVQQKNVPILGANLKQNSDNKNAFQCLICGLTFVQKLGGRFLAVECNICGSIFFFPKLNGSVSAVPEKISAVPEKILTVPEKISPVPEKISAVPEKISDVPKKISAVSEKVSAVLENISAVPEKKDAILMKNLSCWNCGSTSKRVFDIKKTFECKHCHSTLFFSRSPETWTRVKI